MIKSMKRCLWLPIISVGAILDGFSVFMLNLNGVYTDTWGTCGLYGLILALWACGGLCVAEGDW